jgi:hypothetical protein
VVGQKNGKVRVEAGLVTVLSRGCQLGSGNIEQLDVILSYIVRTGSSVDV